jgi:hypothetical protein
MAYLNAILVAAAGCSNLSRGSGVLLRFVAAQEDEFEFKCSVQCSDCRADSRAQ